MPKDDEDVVAAGAAGGEAVDIPQSEKGGGLPSVGAAVGDTIPPPQPPLLFVVLAGAGDGSEGGGCQDPKGGGFPSPYTIVRRRRRERSYSPRWANM